MKSNLNDFLKANYILLSEWEYNCIVHYPSHNKTKREILKQRVFKAKSLNPLPENLILEIKKYFEDHRNLYYSEHRHRSYDGFDFGVWDAVFSYRFVRDNKKWIMEIYISSILRRPFTKEQRKIYEMNSFGDSFASRVRFMYDSQVNQ